MTGEQKTIIAGVVTVDPGIMHGTPCFTGTRVPVQTLLDYIEEGDTVDRFLADFVTVDREQVVQFLEFLSREPIGPEFSESIRRGLAQASAGETIACENYNEMVEKLLNKV